MSICSGSYGETVAGVQRWWPVMFERTDAGRSLSRRAKQKNDCTVRALAIALEMPYDSAYDLLASAGRKCGKGFEFRRWAASTVVGGKRLSWISFTAVKGQSRMNPAKFIAAYPKGRYIVRTAGHVMAVVDGVIYDTHSPRPDRCIYAAWEIQ